MTATILWAAVAAITILGVIGFLCAIADERRRDAALDDSLGLGPDVPPEVLAAALAMPREQAAEFIGAAVLVAEVEAHLRAVAS